VSLDGGINDAIVKLAAVNVQIRAADAAVARRDYDVVRFDLWFGRIP
jgi:hypothetical protein